MEENSPPAPLPPPEKDTPTLTVSGSNAEGTSQNLQVANRERYLVYGVVAEGGQGRIIRAKDLQLGRIVALKELRKPGGELEMRFVREARITACLQHPAIVPVYEAGRWPNGEPFYAMKLVAGRSLARFIDSLPTLAERLAALPHVLTVAEAIAYAHSQRIIHRDLKPANVLVGEFGETVVVDWGLCKELDRPEPNHPEPYSGGEPLGAEFTQEGTVIGTPAYLPPEQAAGKPVDERADVYALGAMLYQLLSGRPPYHGGSAREVLQKVLSEEPVPLARLQPQMPEELLTIVSRAMKREPERRYPSAREFAQDLRRFMSGQLVGSHQYSVWQRMRRFARQYRALLRVAAVALTVLVAGAVLDYQRVRQERDRAEEKADELTIIEARNSLTRSPERVLQMLGSLSPSFAQWGQARIIAADAISLGMGTLLKGHTGALRSIRFSPDGRWLLTTNQDHTARLWDLQAGTSRILATYDSEARFGIFSPDGRYVATSDLYGSIKLCELATGMSRDLTAHSSIVRGLAFSPDSRSLISAGRDGQIRLWDVGSGASRLVGSHSGGVGLIKLLPSGLHVVSVGWADKTARLWNLQDGAGQLLYGGEQSVRAVGLASQADSLALGTSQGQVLWWESLEGQARTLTSGLSSLESISLSPDGRLLVVGGLDGGGGGLKLCNLQAGTCQALMRTKVWDSDPQPRAVFSPDGQWLAVEGREQGSAQLLVVIEVATGATRLLSKANYAGGVAFSPDGDWLAFGEGINIRLFRIKEAWLFPHIVAHHEKAPVIATSTSKPFAKESDINEEAVRTVAAVAWSADGRHVLSAGMSDGTVRFSSMEGKTSVAERAHVDGMRAAYILPNGSRMVTAGADGMVALWDESGRLLQHISVPIQGINVLSLSASGTWVAGGDASGGVWLWDAASGTNRALGRHAESVLTLAFSPDGRYLASGSADGELRLWDVNSGGGRTVHRQREEVSATAFSPDGRFLAAGGSEGTWIQSLEGTSGELLKSGSTGTLVFSPDGRYLFTGGAFGLLMQWDVEAHKFLASLSMSKDLGSVVHMAISPEGQRLAAVGMDGSLYLWDVRSREGRALPGEAGDATRVAFSPDGLYLVSSGTDGTVRVWKDELPLQPEELRAWLHQAAQQ